MGGHPPRKITTTRGERRMSKPSWMSEEQYAEYKMTEEYKAEVCSFDYSSFEYDDDDDYY